MDLLENANVFCVSPNGVVEGHHFLTLVTCRPNFKRLFTPRKRSRFSSLPSSFEDEEDEDVKKVTGQVGGLVRCYSSDNLLKLSRNETFRNVCIKCVSNMIRLKEKGSKKICKKLGLVLTRKGRSKGTASKMKEPLKVVNCPVKTKHGMVVGSGPKMYKSNHQKKTIDHCSGTVLQMDGYMLSYFISEIKRSQVFRESFIRRWSAEGGAFGLGNMALMVFVAIMKRPEAEVLDLLGNKMVNSKILYRRSLEHALSWLSTLGGAFSALGDLSPTYAEEAGHVSFTQLRIAMKLDDPGIQSRCRLYAALSLLQRGYLKSCRDIVRKEYQYAVSLPEGSDPRLRRMCLGIWAKLQYHWKLAVLTDKQTLSKSTKDGLRDIRNNAKYWNVYDLEEGRKIVGYEDQVNL